MLSEHLSGLGHIGRGDDQVLDAVSARAQMGWHIGDDRGGPACRLDSGHDVVAAIGLGGEADIAPARRATDGHARQYRRRLRVVHVQYERSRAGQAADRHRRAPAAGERQPVLPGREAP